MIPEKAMKLLTLALDPAAQSGECESAAIKFVQMLRAEKITAYDLFKQLPDKRNDGKSGRSSVIFPFGKWKGMPMKSIETNYLLWVIKTLTNISPALKSEILRELEHRQREGF